jgi:hypothetical protein
VGRREIGDGEADAIASRESAARRVGCLRAQDKHAEPTGVFERTLSGLPSHVNQGIEVVFACWVPSRQFLLEIFERDNVDKSIGGCHFAREKEKAQEREDKIGEREKDRDRQQGSAAGALDRAGRRSYMR